MDFAATDTSAKEVFHKQVRIGVPQHIYGGSDGGSEGIVKNPEYATSIGLLLYAKEKNNLRYNYNNRNRV